MTPPLPRCAWCNKPFTPKIRLYTGANQFCSPACRKAHLKAQAARIFRSTHYRRGEAERGN